MRGLLKNEIMLARFRIYENGIFIGFELRQPSRSARAARRPKAAGKEKRRETAFTAGRTRHGFRPTGKLVRPYQGKNFDLTGKEFRPNRSTSALRSWILGE